MTDYYEVCDKGGREQNQDSVLCLQKGDAYLFSVADGLGGYADSRLASLFVHEVLKELFTNDFHKEKDKDFDEEKTLDLSCSFGREDIRDDFLDYAVNVCQDILLEYKEQSGIRDSYTTIVILLIIGNKAQWCHVGDSRIYYFKQGVPKERSADHSVPQMLFNAGMIREDQIRNHPDRSKLLRAVGRGDKELQVDVSDIHELSTGDAFLLCSDGFWEYVTEEEMENSLRSIYTARDWITAMETCVKDGGKDKNADNYSAVGVLIKED